RGRGRETAGMTGVALPPDSPRTDDRAGPSHIGPRLRAQRERLGLSLRELARRIGVSASLISQIERDKVNPSVSTLYSLVRALGLGMGDLCAPDEAPSAEAAPVTSAHEPRVTPEHRAVINLASGVTWERLTAAGDPILEFLRVVYAPGSESCPEDSLVRHGGREDGYGIGRGRARAPRVCGG